MIAKHVQKQKANIFYGNYINKELSENNYRLALP